MLVADKASEKQDAAMQAASRTGGLLNGTLAPLKPTVDGDQGIHQADNITRTSAQSFMQRKCAECEKEEENQVRRKASDVSGGGTVTNSFSNALQASASGGHAMDRDTGSFMSSRFGTDLSNVRIHTDSASASLSRQINARAFTYGNDIYFNSNQYKPNTTEGKHLLAHELTHTLQQTGSLNRKLIQRACFEEGSPSITPAACPEGATDVGRQAQGQPNAVDTRADAIVAIAAGTGANQDKAMQVVNSIICSYMPSQASKVRKIYYFATQIGLRTQSVGSGATAQGDICVGDDFLTNTTRTHISRRVLQVAHELEHIEQYRTGLSGGNNRILREFLAFYHEGTADEFIGTGRMQHGTRKRLIDAAIGAFFCLDATTRATHLSKLQDLQARRLTVNGTNGNAPTPEPTTCVTP
ncbi:DUF4157 domain-containing protein [Mucilaginibacter sp. JRF]|uniref:eCIS core domain-containing protein n=1 Tax=Mucilaginibacter sp. JRF TaxID=2780088 RepID=UPI0018818F2F|nr:DUF4157 domain-containing protein [Mucilaginibacter sp. JRF]MBE9586601.1 DUF4157 domain-containing protein [Mucilaginibacter sp. JRF]